MLRGIKDLSHLITGAIVIVILFGWASLAFAEGVKVEVGTNMEESESTSQVATFAGGCFWCMQPPFDKQPGVLATIVGYTGGSKPDPTYEEIGGGTTGHAEAVRVLFDPKVVSYEKLLEIFWRNIDPTDGGGQFADRGSQYRTAIFFHSEEQRKLATESLEYLRQSAKFSNPIKTEIAPAGEFYRAEEYHQDYYKKNAVHYKLYRAGSGREGFINEVWKETSK